MGFRKHPSKGLTFVTAFVVGVEREQMPFDANVNE